MDAKVMPRPAGYEAVLMDYVRWVVVVDNEIVGGFRTKPAAQKYADSWEG